MRLFQIIILIAVTLISQISYAIEGVSLSGPNPAIANTYQSGDKAIIIYTVTKRVPNINIPITLSGFSNPVSRITVENDCGNMIKANVSSCNIGLLIAPIGEQAGQVFHQTFALDYQGRTHLTKDITFSVAKMLHSAFVITGTNTATQKPILLLNIDGKGDNWNIKSSDFFPDLRSFSSIACSGNIINGICVAAGSNNDTSKASLVVSQNGGNDWIMKNTIAGLLNTVSCTGQNKNTSCIAAGIDQNQNNSPVITVSQDGANTWITKSITNSLTNTTITGSSCTGQSGHAVCTVSGWYNGSTSFIPLLIVSSDNGNSWKQITNLSSSGRFYSTSCAGNYPNTVCTVVGNSTLAVSKDNGSTWIRKDTPESLNAVNCTGNGSSTICAAVGGNLIQFSKDGGDTWKANLLPMNNVSLNAINCNISQQGDSATCIAAGIDNSHNNTPFLVVSNDNGNTWSNKSIDGMPGQSKINSIRCNGNGTSAVCIALGQGLTPKSSTSIFVQSMDGGNTWAMKNVSPSLLASFNQVSVLGGS